MSRRTTVAVAVATLFVLAGCGGGHAGRAGGSPGPPCIATATATASGAPSGGAADPAAEQSAAESRSAARPPLPDIALACFAGGRPVRLARLGTPTVINLWASWCAPCRTELPEVQRYADRAAGRVLVVGVITDDPNRGGAQSLVNDLRLRFPMLYDERGDLQKEVGDQVLPMTLLVDGRGRVAYRHTAQPLDEAALSDLVARYLGVRA